MRSVLLISKPDKYITDKENHKPISIKLKKNQIHQYLKMILHYSNLVFILGLQDQLKIAELVNIDDHIHRLKIKIII